MDIKQLEQLMVENGLVIRAIPFMVRSVFEASAFERLGEGEVKFLPEFGREMLVIEKKTKYGGKFKIEVANHTLSTVQFSTKSPYYNSFEEAVNAVLERGV